MTSFDPYIPHKLHNLMTAAEEFHLQHGPNAHWEINPEIVVSLINALEEAWREVDSYKEQLDRLKMDHLHATEEEKR